MSNSGNIKVSVISKPFIVSALILVFAGSIIGSIWMMSLLGASIPFTLRVFPLHKIFQVDGFLTLLIMGVGYMIVPRFRNANLPCLKLAYLSLSLVLLSITMSIISTIDNIMIELGRYAHFSGVAIFASIMIWMLRIRPRLLRMADCFIMLSIIILLAINAINLLDVSARNQLSEVQLWLLFPILMIFGIEYKTLPSFLGFIRPVKKLSIISFGLTTLSVALGLLSSIYGSLAFAAIFNIILLGAAITFAFSVYIFGGFDNKEILRFIEGENKARYMYTILHSRLAFIFLYTGISIAAAFSIVENNYILYDLAIHYVAIGFIGITIALYLPLMLPPITGNMVHFTKFNSIPILLVVVALAMRTAGNIVITTQMSSDANYFLMMSGWLIVSALFLFVTMVRRSKQKMI